MAVDNVGTYTAPLQQLVAALDPKTVLEVGLGEAGYSTQVWLASGAKVTCIDKNNLHDTAGKLGGQYKGAFTFIQETSQHALPRLSEQFDLIFIDGDHTYEGCKQDIANAQRLAPHGVILVDDYGVISGVVDVDPAGNLIYGDYGIKQAADELFKGKWRRVYADIPFANGARAYAYK